jgi:hypothetical protein
MSIPTGLPSIGRRGLLAVAGGLVASPAILRAEGQAGVALVIGNSKYKWEASLPNVARDAPDIAERFQALGLKTELLQDTGQDAMRAALDRFAAAARGANLAAFYFAGHGASWDKDTYLVPTDANLNDPSTVRSLLPVSTVSAATKEATHRLLIFDSCRNNPADGWRQKEAVDLARYSATEQTAATLSGPNTLVLFSTAPGRVAIDGLAGENSPFAREFMRQLEDPSLDLQTLAPKLRRGLLIATQCRQLVWDQNTFTGPFQPGGRANRQSAAPRANDSSKIVELTNAYAFARENALPLPPGLIALRPLDNQLHGDKLGSFRFTTRTYFGPAGYADGPAVLIVMSISDSNTVEAVLATQSSATTQGVNNYDIHWRFLPCRASEKRLEFSSIDGNVQYQFSWQDRNSGRLGQTIAGASSALLSTHSFNSRFLRLDG